MARTLNATLDTAQDNASRRPIVEITSQQATTEIPFDGQRISMNETYPNIEPSIFYHSSGRILGFVVKYRGGNSGSEKYDYLYFYSDVNRTEWNYVNLEMMSYLYYTGGQVAMVERTSDNNVILAYRTPYSTYKNSRILYQVISATGSVVSTYGTITALTGDAGDRLSDPTLAKIGSNYWCLYFYKNVTDDKYDILYKTSTDGVTWGSETQITVGGLDDTKVIKDPKLFVATSGKVILTFAYETNETDSGIKEYNVYWTESTDSGSTWSTAVDMTGNTSLGISYDQPDIDEYSNENLTLSYTKILSAIVTQTPYGTYNPFNEPAVFLYDHVNRDLYIMHVEQSLGTKTVFGVKKVDIDTWTVTQTYDENSTPAYSDIMIGNVSDGSGVEINAWHQEYPYLVHEQWNNVAVLNVSTNTITEYYFEDSVTYSTTCNVRPEPSGMNKNWSQYLDAYIKDMTVDATNHKLWISFADVSGLAAGANLCIGYIDLTEVPDGEGYYTWNEIVRHTCYINGKTEDATAQWMDANQILVPGDGKIYFCTTQSSVWYDNPGWYGVIWVFSESSGGLIDSYHYGNTSGLPKNGLITPFFYGTKIYGGVPYTDVENQEDRRGICVFDTELITTRYIDLPEGQVYYAIRYDGDGGLIALGTKGFCVMDIVSETWTYYTPDEIASLPAIPSGDCKTFCYPAYNITDQVYYVGCMDLIDAYPYYAAVPKAGTFEQGWYEIGAIQGDDTYVWGTPAQLLLGNQEDGVQVAIDGDDSLWAHWTHERVSDSTLYSLWDNEAGIFDMSDYLVAGKPVTAKWSIADPSWVKFSVSHGHLFDPSNTGSILSVHLRKGRKITLRFGEYVSGNYWENQGTFFVSENRLTYQREQYPVMECKATDRLANWKEGVIRATQHFAEAYPETIITTLISNYGEDYLTVSDYNIPTLSWRHTIWHQFIDRTLWEMLEILGDHFGFVMYQDLDGVVTTREIDFTAAVDHAYSDTTRLINYTPNDEYSTLVNRITVMGETRTFTEVTYEYERMGNLSGTIGWWGDDADKKLYYSNDETLEAVNPYLVVNQSSADFEVFVFQGGGGESIKDIDQQNRWVEVEIEAPNLVGVFVGTLAAFIAMAVAALTCNGPYNPCGIYVFGTSMLSSILINLLGAVANYDIDVYAQPMGREKRAVQATADDIEFQAEIGRIVEEFIDDPLCYTQQSCQHVADQEIALIKGQRVRVNFEKITHLQDEVGDILSLPHPHSGDTLTLMITELERVFLRPEPGGSSGYFKDKIEGWRLT